MEKGKGRKIGRKRGSAREGGKEWEEGRRGGTGGGGKGSEGKERMKVIIRELWDKEKGEGRKKGRKRVGGDGKRRKG